MGDRIVGGHHLNVEALLRRPGIGHNQGPPLDSSWEMWIWKRAVAKAWKTPPREVALQRLARAERLGLSYREYTAVLMDRGRSLTTAVFALGALGATRVPGGDGGALGLPPEVTARLAGLRCRIVVVGDPAVDRRALAGWPPEAFGRALDRAMGGKLSALVVPPPAPRRAGPDPRLAALTAALAREGVAPGEAFLVGLGADDARLAEDAGLALRKDAWAYFAPA